MLRLPLPAVSFRLRATLAALCGLALFVAASNAQAIQITLEGVGFVEFIDEDLGEPVAEGVLSLEFTFDLSGATLASPGDPDLYIGAATNPEAFVDLLELSVFGPVSGPDLSGLPYFTIFAGTGSDGTPNDVGDAFVGAVETSISFPTNPDGGAPTAVPEPAYVSFVFLGPSPTDLAGVVAALLAAPDPITLFDSVSVDLSLFAAGVEGIEDVLFEIDSITVVPEPSTALLLGLGLSGLALRGRR